MEDAAKYRGLFPLAFTLSCFCVFGYPVTVGMHLSQEPSVVYWIGWSARLVLVVPLMLVICHILHLIAGRPRFYIVFFSTVVPAGLLMVIANLHLVNLSTKTDALLSADCTADNDKQDLRRAWKAANDIFVGCGGSAAAASARFADLGTKVAQFRGSESPRPHQAEGPISKCEAYTQALTSKSYQNYFESWSYLMSLERSQHCSGWCDSGDAMWTYEETRDLCNQAAGAVLFSVVKPAAVRMLVSSLLVLAASILAISKITLELRKTGGEW